MDDLVPFGSREYCLSLLVLIFGRGMDILSTWVATPNLALEGNPVAKWLGWRRGILVNLAVSAGLALSPSMAIAVSTMSVLVASRNFQSAWIMRSMGEAAYRDWYVRRLQETRAPLLIFCIFGQTLLTAAVGIGIMYFGSDRIFAAAIGLGIVCYAGVVAFYTLLAVWRLRRAYDRQVADSFHVFTDTR